VKSAVELPHLLVNVDEKVVETFDGNQAESRKLHVCYNVERERQTAGEITLALI
jgi:hypothetical protein